MVLTVGQDLSNQKDGVEIDAAPRLSQVQELELLGHLSHDAGFLGKLVADVIHRLLRVLLSPERKIDIFEGSDFVLATTTSARGTFAAERIFKVDGVDHTVLNDRSLIPGDVLAQVVKGAGWTTASAALASAYLHPILYVRGEIWSRSHG